MMAPQVARSGSAHTVAKRNRLQGRNRAGRKRPVPASSYEADTDLLAVVAWFAGAGRKATAYRIWQQLPGWTLDRVHMRLDRLVGNGTLVRDFEYGYRRKGGTP